MADMQTDADMLQDTEQGCHVHANVHYLVLFG